MGQRLLLERAELVDRHGGQASAGRWRLVGKIAESGQVAGALASTGVELVSGLEPHAADLDGDVTVGVCRERCTRGKTISVSCPS
jgi:hypothetical protein